MERMIEVPIPVIVIGVVALIALLFMVNFVDRRIVQKRAETLLAGKGFPHKGCWHPVDGRDGFWYESCSDKVWRKMSRGWQKVA